MADKTLKINGREYAEADFNEAARTMLRNIAITDQKIAGLKQELALFQVAREAFGTALLGHLPDDSKAVGKNQANAFSQDSTTLN